MIMECLKEFLENIFKGLRIIGYMSLEFSKEFEWDKDWEINKFRFSIIVGEIWKICIYRRNWNFVV